MLRPLVFQSRKQGAALAVTAGALASFLALVAYAVFQAIVSSTWLRAGWLVLLAGAIAFVARQASRARTTVGDGFVEVRSVLGSRRLSIDEVVDVVPMSLSGQVNCVRILLRSGDSVIASSVPLAQRAALSEAIFGNQPD